jgi:hypothetical protein
VPFQNPVAYVGAAPLMWEVWIRTVTATTPTHYFERGPGGAHTAGAVGTGCTVTGQSGPLTSRGTTNLAQVSETLTNAPAVATRYVTLGFAGNSYGGLPLPVSLAATGSVGCFINIDFRLLLPPTTATTLTAPYPWSVGVAGARFRTQWVVDDQGLIRTSNGLDHSIPYSTAWPVRRVYATSFSTSAPPPSGTVTANGLVTQFY